MRKGHYDRHYKLSGAEFGSTFGDDDDYDSDFGNIIEDVGDVATSAWDRTVGKVIPDFVKDGIRKFADSAIGHVVLIAVSSSFYGALAPTMGAQAAAIVFALPGMARGDNFVKAWTDGFMERLTILIKYFVGQGVPDDKAAEQVTDAAQADMQKVQEYANKAGVANVAKMTIEQLASLLGIREDMAAEWLSNANGDLSLPHQYQFDPKTGKIIGKSKNVWDKVRMVEATIDPSKATTGIQKAMAIANIQAILMRHKNEAKSKMKDKALVSTGVAGVGAAAALLLGASLPITLGVAGGLGLLTWLTKK